MNKLQQKSILLVWAASREPSEILSASKRLSTTEKIFFKEALLFQRSPAPLEEKKFQTLLNHLNGKFSLTERVKNIFSRIFGKSESFSSTIESFKNDTTKKVEDRVTELTAIITEQANNEDTPKNRRVIAYNELSRDLLSQALSFMTAQPIEARIEEVKEELKNPELSEVQRKRKEIVLESLVEKQSKDQKLVFRQSVTRFLQDVEIDKKINHALIGLIENPKARLNAEAIGKVLETGDKTLEMKLEKLMKQATITILANKEVDVLKKHEVFRLTSDNLKILKVERETLNLKETAYTLFQQALPKGKSKSLLGRFFNTAI